MVSGFFELSAGAPRAIVRREGETEKYRWVSRIGARIDGEKSGPELFRDSVEPGSGTSAIVIGVLRRAHAQALHR